MRPGPSSSSQIARRCFPSRLAAPSPGMRPLGVEPSKNAELQEHKSLHFGFLAWRLNLWRRQPPAECVHTRIRHPYARRVNGKMTAENKLPLRDAGRTSRANPPLAKSACL